MAKLTKAQAKAHAAAVERLQQDILTEDDKEFVFRNWNEGANHVNGAAGAFFTPYDMAFDFAFDVGGPRVIDLCAGIGMLSYAVLNRGRHSRLEITCIERNADYIEVGKKLLPEAEWICADVFDVIGMGLHEPELFDYAISNPPFGNIRREKNAPRYSGKDVEFHVIDIASHIARNGTFIVPQVSAGFNFSGLRAHSRQTDGKAFKFQELTGLHFDCGVGVDTAYYQNDWKGVSPLCEIVCVDFTEARVVVPTVAPPIAANDNQQTDLFGVAA